MAGNTFRPFGGDQVAVIAGEDSRHEISCFADEVVVDFPSVASAVDRIRRGLIADERTPPVPATVTISRREGLLGVTVPLEVPVRCTCRACGGRGESWTESCTRCHGAGTELLRHLLQVTLPSGTTDGARFQFTVTARHNPPTRIELHVVIDQS
jgi:hypothetical protein